MSRFTTGALAAAIAGGLAFASVGAQALPRPDTAISRPSANTAWMAMSKKKMMMMKKKRMMMKKNGRM